MQSFKNTEIINSMIGERFGRLVVTNHYKERLKSGEIRDFCDVVCDCGKNKQHIFSKSLRSGDSKSCGCFRSEEISKRRTGKNIFYFLENDEVKGIDQSGNEFYFDLIDLDKISKTYWYVNPDGYVFSNTLNISMHSFIMGERIKCEIDHVNRIRCDNRRKNIRFATRTENNLNKPIYSNNKTGIIGVFERKGWKKSWHANFTNPLTKKRTWFYSADFVEAVKWRLEQEKEYYGEFAPQIHLFKEYKI